MATSGDDGAFCAGEATDIGGRKENQDTSFGISLLGGKVWVGAVFDGHGSEGKAAAEYARDRVQSVMQQRAAQLVQRPEDVLRDLLREEGVAVDGDLVQAAVDAFGDDKEDEDSFFDESDGPGPGVAFARPASPESEDERRPRDPRDDRSERAVYEPASDTERRPRDPRFVRPHASSSSDSDDSGILPGPTARGGFVGALRGRTSQHNLGDLGPTHVAAAPGVQDEVEFWLDGAARARTPRVPEPPPEGAWFWGDS